MSGGRRGHRILLSDTFSGAEPHGLSSPSGSRIAQFFAVLWTFSARSDAPGATSRGKTVAARHPGAGSSDRFGRQRKRPHQQTGFAEAGLARFIEEANLRVHVAALRKLLGDEAAGGRYINTVAGRGYCFVAPVTRTEEATDGPARVLALPEPAHHLPVSLTRVIGRADSVSAISSQLTRRRFATIIGPGGIGKTTVALAVAAHLADSYEHKACFVELASLTDERLIPRRAGVRPGIVDPRGPTGSGACCTSPQQINARGARQLRACSRCRGDPGR
jgi:hypothetical protein